MPYSSEFTDRETNMAYLDSLVSFDVKGGERGELIEGELTEAGNEELLKSNPFRPTLSNTLGIHDIWPFLVVLCGTVFFADVLIRRVALDFDWIGDVAKRFFRREEIEVETKMSRLQSKKAEIEKQIQMKRANTRFAPEVDENASGAQKLEQVIGDEIDESADRRMPRKRAKSLEIEQEEQSYTSRLLDAKRKAQQQRKTNDDTRKTRKI